MSARRNPILASMTLALLAGLAAMSSLRAQSISAAAAQNDVIILAQATTNVAPVSPVPPEATNSAPVDGVTNSAPLNPADTNSAPSSENDDMGSPGATGAPGTELIGPPAPGSQVPPPEGSDGGIPTNNPAVQDITNQPGLAVGLGQRKLPFYFGLNLGEMYDDNILLAPNYAKQDAFITIVQPSLDYQLGDQTSPHMNYLNLYFSPTIYAYDTRSDFDRTDYDADIYYQYTWTRLQLGFEQRYQYLTGTSIDDNAFVSRNIYTTKIDADYQYNDDLTLFGTVTQTINSYPGFTLNEWDLDNYALYQVAPKLLLGAGPRFSWLDVQDAPRETQQDLLFRLRYKPDDKLTVSFDGGVEYLQYEGNLPDRLLPIFDANATWAPWNDTGLFLSGSRSTANSYDIRGDTIDISTVQVGASQRFLQRFSFTATGGYSNAEYQNTVATDSSTQREDNYYFVKGELGWFPNDWLKVEASYQFSNQDSTFVQNTFTDNQFELQSSVKF